jgi:FkbM family methyltransferase
MMFRWFRNWRSIMAACRAGDPLPSLVLRNGLIIHYGPSDSPLFIFNEIFREHCYTRHGFYRPRPGDTVVDLGANIGLFALYLQSRAPGIRIHCFEPATPTRERLERNLSANGLSADVSVYPLAVCDRERVAALKQGRNSGVRSLVPSADTSTGVEIVPCVGLSEALELCRAEHVDLLKIDVEGSEVEILEGAGDTVWKKIDRVALEFHDQFRPGCRERVLGVLQSHGYRKVEVEGSRRHPQVGVIRACR